MLFMHADPFLLAVQSNGHQCLAHLAWVANCSKDRPRHRNKRTHPSTSLVQKKHDRTFALLGLVPKSQLHWSRRWKVEFQRSGNCRGQVGQLCMTFLHGLTPISCEGGMHAFFVSDVMCSIGCIAVCMWHGMVGIGRHGNTCNSCHAMPCHAPSCIQKYGKTLPCKCFYHQGTCKHLSALDHTKRTPQTPPELPHTAILPCSKRPPIFCVLRVWAEFLQTQVLHHWCHLVPKSSSAMTWTSSLLKLTQLKWSKGWL